MPKKTEAKKTTEKKIVEKVGSTGKGSQTLRGFRDILPEEQKYWHFIEDKVKKFALGYGFFQIQTPLLEETTLFIRSVGKQTDIVEKEMFSFVDQGGSNVTLRPEATASVARAYISHGMVNLPQPVKLYYWGPMFRRERPQSGRTRQFFQFGFEVLGEDKPVVDAQLISLAYHFYQELGLKDISLQANSIGCPTCRQEYIQELVNYYKPKKRLLCEDCKKRLTKNPLRLLDCKESACQSLLNEAPQILDWLDEDCKNHFMNVLEYLEELEIPYFLNPYLVRGLDYYTRTVFEIWPEEKGGSQSALVGGGRYDDLIELLGGRPTPGSGFSAGVERTILQLKEKEIEVKDEFTPEVFIAQIGQQAKMKAMVLFEKMRQKGFKVAENFAKDGLKTQLELANKLNVKYALILGQKEVLDGTILIRDMESGVQEIMDFEKIIPEIRKKLET